MNLEQRTEMCENLELAKLSPAEIKLHRLKNRLWKDGVWRTFRRVLSKALPHHSIAAAPVKEKFRNGSGNGEVLNLQPGELVEIKPADEIMKTLDSSEKHRGLSFMPEMWKYCGERRRVYKRVNQIVLVGAESMKKLKNTVLLEGVFCDGSDHSYCDSSCFHFWREVWLRRIPDPGDGRVLSGATQKETAPVENNSTS
ncbi:MAG: hypothetical protein ACYC9O_12220 [Candidatus Latescibacterota bacterium]